MGKPKYQRVVLKLSGEALAGDEGFGINRQRSKKSSKRSKKSMNLVLKWRS